MIVGTPKSLRPVLQGAGRRESDGPVTRLVNGVSARGSYTNAQLCDYLTLRREDFPWRAPLVLSLEARFSGPTDDLRGTAGFGFWNDPMAWNPLRKPALPRAAWFLFASQHSNMRLSTDVPGNGWKATAVDALSMPAPLLLPVMGTLAPLMRVSWFFRRVWPAFERRLRVCEQRIEVDVRSWAYYELEWKRDRLRFSVDGATIMDCASAPAGRLGLVIWIDNQYLVATPCGSLRHGVVALEHEQWMEVRGVAVRVE